MVLVRRMSSAQKSHPITLSFKYRIGRMALLVLGISSPTAGIWGGLLRLPMRLPVGPASWISFH
jgi:hypothetical protein